MEDIKEIYLKDYKQPSFKIVSVDLVFELFEEFVWVTNSMKIEKLDLDETTLSLDSIDLELEELWLNDLRLKEPRYNIKDEKLEILNVPSLFSIKIKNKIYPTKNTELEGLYKSGDIFCTQNEPEGFRTITPYLDRPDVMSIFTTTIIADKTKYPILLSNGNKQESCLLEDGRHSVTWFDPFAKSSYLFAVVAGDLGSISDSFTTFSNRKIELNIYCDLGNEDRCYHAMKSLKEAMVWDEEKYGREYDLDIYNIVAVDSFNMGAMENKGLNIFNSHYVLADTNTATDDNFMGIQSVIAHEYFHNWTGNRITCRDWFQLTLKEGLTVFRDQCFSADLNSKDVQRIKDVKSLRERQFVEDASPTSHPIQPKSYISMNNFYTATVYEKGAEVIRMLYTILGEEKFRKATDLYFAKFDSQAVTIKEFLWAMGEASGIDLSYFKNWYHKKGTPVLELKQEYNDGILRVKCRLSDELYVPLKVGIIEQDGTNIKDELLIIDELEKEFVFEGLKSEPILSINRDFSAPIIVKQEKENFDFLMKYDNNSFNRYEATQEYAIQTINAIMEDKEVDENFIEAYGYLLDLKVDNSFKALLLELPSLVSVIQDTKDIDMQKVCDAQDRLALKIAITYKSKLLSLYNSLDFMSISSRALKNRVLMILSPLDTNEIVELAQKQYNSSKTMTEKIVALSVLEDMECVDSSEYLRDFYQEYSSNSLVMSKYFVLIASSSRKGVLQRVLELEEDKVFDMKVPNLVRALIGSFSRNFRYFYAKDGSGFKYLAKKIIEIDKINAQIASGLCGAFKMMQRVDDLSKEMMRKELECIISTHSLSKNSFEIISKILDNK